MTTSDHQRITVAAPTAAGSRTTASSERADARPFPLEGIRVLDLSRAVSGPHAGRVLADLGAEVVKFEPRGGDIAQAVGKRTGGRSGLFVQLNAGKRNVSIDIATEEGANLVRRLARTADVIIENFRPGVLQRAGLDHPALSVDNPGLVMLSITGFGQWGPDSQRQAYAPVVHAESGFLLARQAELDDAAPVDLALALADSIAGLHGAIAVLAALQLRHSTGAGQHIDISMLEALLASDDYAHFSADEHPVWASRGYVWAAPGGPLLVAADPKFLWSCLHKHAGLNDPDPTAEPARKFNERERLIREWIGGFADREELKRALEAADLAWAEIRTPTTIKAAPSVIARSVFVPIPDGLGGSRPVVRMPYRFSGARCEPRGGAGTRGADDRKILGSWLGIEDEEFQTLRMAGALAPTEPPGLEPTPSPATDPPRIRRQRDGVDSHGS